MSLATERAASGPERDVLSQDTLQERFTNLSGWGNTFQSCCQVVKPSATGPLFDLLRMPGKPPLIARGCGRSYGDAALNTDGVVVDMGNLNRIVAVDEASAMVDCEAGVTIGQLVAELMPRGFTIPVTPGTRHVTVGGAIANDVHGKNQHKFGNFSNAVVDLELFCPALGVQSCSPSRNSDLFWATVGGVGLTGVILRARLRLQPVPSAYIHLTLRKCRDLEETLGGILEEDGLFEYAVGWLDCLARGRKLGRSVLIRGDSAQPANLPKGLADSPHAYGAPGEFHIPFSMPLMNRLSATAMNAFLFHRYRQSHEEIISYNEFMYPLDRIANWNRFYGRRGFVEYQALLPSDDLAGVRELLELLSASGRPSFLSAIKRFGPGSQGYLSFPTRGFSLVLDMANVPGIQAFLHELDRVVLSHGGRVYLAKDSTTTADTVREMYPDLDRFLEVRRKVDPNGRLSSSMGRRLGLVW